MAATPHLRDADLSILSLQIANEIDKVQANQSANQHIIDAFRDKLSTKAGIERQSGSARLGADAFTIGILGRAVRASQARPIRQIQELVEALERLIHNLKPEQFQKDSEELQALKSFCLSLHEAITVSRTPRVSRDSAQLFDEIRVG